MLGSDTDSIKPQLLVAYRMFPIISRGSYYIVNASATTRCCYNLSTHFAITLIFQYPDLLVYNVNAERRIQLKLVPMGHDK